MAPLAGECQKIFVAAIFAFHAGKTVVQVPAIEVMVNNLLQIGPPETILKIWPERYHNLIVGRLTEPFLADLRNLGTISPGESTAWADLPVGPGPSLYTVRIRVR